jgi:hypothetical protein
MRPAAHPFGVSGDEEDGGDGNAVHLGAAEAAGGRPNLRNDDADEAEVSGNVLPSPEPAELIAGQDGDAGPADEDSRQAGSCGFEQFLEGIGEEDHLNSLSSGVMVSDGDGELEVRPPAHPFGVPGEEHGGDGNAVHFGAAEAAGGKVQPSPEPAELMTGQDGNAGPAHEDSRQADIWGFTQFLEGIGEEEHSTSLSAVVAEWLKRAKPKGFTGTDFDFAKSTGSNLAKITDMLRQRDSEGRDLTDALALEICRAMKLLEQQEVEREMRGMFLIRDLIIAEFLHVI